MKKLAIILALAALGGCATPYYPATYGTRAYAPVDANGWQTVSVTPVPVGTAAAANASGDAGRVTSQPIAAQQMTSSYSPAVVYSPVVAEPVYVGAPYYAAPYYDPFWYPPVSIGLNFGWSNWGGRGWGGGRGGYHGGGFHGGGRGHR